MSEPGKTNKREFLKTAGLTTASAVAARAASVPRASPARPRLPPPPDRPMPEITPPPPPPVPAPSRLGPPASAGGARPPPAARQRPASDRLAASQLADEAGEAPGGGEIELGAGRERVEIRSFGCPSSQFALRVDDEQASRMHAVIEVAGPDDITLIDLGNGLEIPGSWLPEGVTVEQVAAGLRPLLDKPVEIVLPTHGEPTDRAALERALA